MALSKLVPIRYYILCRSPSDSAEYWIYDAVKDVYVETFYTLEQANLYVSVMNKRWTSLC